MTSGTSCIYTCIIFALKTLKTLKSLKSLKTPCVASNKVHKKEMREEN